MPKRRRSDFIKREESPVEDIEDTFRPAPSSKLAQKLPGFAYEGTTQRSTRAQAKRLKSESFELPNTAEEQGTHIPTPKAKKAPPSASPKKPKPIQMELTVPHSAPPNWRETYDLIKDMRKDIEAPVDTMGCACAMKGEQDPKIRRFGTLISLMLSSQTKDEVTTDAVRKLETSLGELSIDKVLEADEAVISEAICKVGFWRRKTGYIKQAAIKLRDDFNSDVPQTVDELCSLPGVGPKMAFLALQVAWNLNLGIGVGVHVHRITNRLGWHKPPTTTPEQTRLNLQSWLPKELHPDINPLLVGFGQVICLPIGPKCGSCVLSPRGLCPSASPTKTSPTKPKKLKRSVTELMKEEDLVKIEQIDDTLVLKPPGGMSPSPPPVLKSDPQKLRVQSSIVPP